MALQKLVYRPGINKENTNYANEGGFYDCDKVRFRSGFPEKIGGWTRLSNNQYLGTARSLWNWATLNGSNLLGVGTNLKYYIERGGQYNDITPIRRVVNLTNPFTATTGSATIQVSDPSHGCVTGDFVTFSGAAGLGGNITAAVLNQEYQITVIDAATYSFQAKSPTTWLPVLANASDTGNGGTPQAFYQINVGLDVYVTGNGWGAGPWSRGTWGSGSSTGTSIGQQLRLWSNDNFGEDLVIAPRGGSIYYWDASTGLSARAQLLNTVSTSLGYQGQFVPNQTNQIIASSVQRFVIAFGANGYDPLDSNTPFDPLLVRWSDQENAYDWVPTPINQSGEQRLTNGSYIVTAKNTRQEILIWTDAAIYSMQYLGPPYVWGITMLQDNISIMSPNSAITVNNVTYWMGTDKFFMYSGRVETLPCSVRQFVFQNLNKNQAWQCFAGSNEQYSEIWWFYPSTNSNVVDSYVVYNYLDRVWYYGTMGRTAWLDSGIRQYPMGADYNNRILYHEVGVDDVSGETPAPITAYIQSSDFDIGDGHNFGFVWRILPDLTFDGSTTQNPQVTMTIKPRVNSGTNYGIEDSPVVVRTATVPVQQFTGQVYVRLRGRQLAFRIDSTDLGVAWQLGAPRIDIRPDGRR